MKEVEGKKIKRRNRRRKGNLNRRERKIMINER